MNLADLRARVRRLDALARGLAKEVQLWRQGDDPLRYLERKIYVEAIQDARAGAESARLLLAKVCQRLEAEQRGERGETTP